MSEEGKSLAFVEGYMIRYAKDGKNSTIFGVPVTELSRDALLGLVGFIGKEMNNQQENYFRTISFLQDCKGVN